MINMNAKTSIKRSGAEKLQPRFFGPYRVSRRIGTVDYELELPQGKKIHNVFHVSCLKKSLANMSDLLRHYLPWMRRDNLF